MKLLLFLGLLNLNIFSLFSQGSDLRLVNQKRKFVEKSELAKVNHVENYDFIVLNKDTLVAVRDTISDADLKVLCKYYLNDSLVKRYCQAALRYYDEKPPRIQQWGTTVNVHLTEEISLEDRKNLQEFFKPISRFNNFSLNFVKKKRDANYLVISSDTLIDRVKKDSITFAENYALNRINYKIHKDSNNKFYTGTAQIDLNNIQNRTLILPKLKQMLFLSFAQFAINSRFPKNSLISTSYVNSDSMSELDIALLEMHYFKIFDQNFDALGIYKLKRYALNKCDI